jgi:nitroimidazol reductase NimA-like FMN-containing flavoprotein (pyridoxamine 5'-phosphate oxidase superfamily)
MPRHTQAPSDRTRLRRMHTSAATTTLKPSTRCWMRSLLCHVGYVLDGAPQVTPTLQWREGDHVYWHGSSASRFLRAAIANPVCLTVTLWDGMVLARSGMHHSANYRSCMAYGTAEMVDDPAHKEASLEAMFDRWFPGRWPDAAPHDRPGGEGDDRAAFAAGRGVGEDPHWPTEG